MLFFHITQVVALSKYHKHSTTDYWYTLKCVLYRLVTREISLALKRRLDETIERGQKYHFFHHSSSTRGMTICNLLFVLFAPSSLWSVSLFSFLISIADKDHHGDLSWKGNYRFVSRLSLVFRKGNMRQRAAITLCSRLPWHRKTYKAHHSPFVQKAILCQWNVCLFRSVCWMCLCITFLMFQWSSWVLLWRTETSHLTHESQMHKQHDSLCSLHNPAFPLFSLDPSHPMPGIHPLIHLAFSLLSYKPHHEHDRATTSEGCWCWKRRERRRRRGCWRSLLVQMTTTDRLEWDDGRFGKGARKKGKFTILPA